MSGRFSNTITVPSIIPPINNYLTHLADFGVPVFFFVSGFVLSLRYFNSLDMKGFYRRRLTVIVLPYLAFSALYIIYNFFTVADYTAGRALWSIVLFDATGIFWFIAVLLQLYLLFPLLTRWQRASEARGRGWVDAGSVHGGVRAVVRLLSRPHRRRARRHRSAGPRVRRHRGRADLHRLPALLRPGHLGAADPAGVGGVDSAVPARPAVGAGRAAHGPGAGLVSSQVYLWALLVLPFSVLMLGLLYRLSRWLAARQGAMSRSVRTRWGSTPYGIYLAHILVIAVIVNRMWAAGLSSEQGYILPSSVLIGTIVLSIAALFVLNLLPFGELLTGVRSKARLRKREKPAPGPREGRV